MSLFNTLSRGTTWSIYDRKLVILKYAWWLYKNLLYFLLFFMLENVTKSKYLEILCYAWEKLAVPLKWTLDLTVWRGGKWLYLHMLIGICVHVQSHTAMLSHSVSIYQNPWNDTEEMGNSGCLSTVELGDRVFRSGDVSLHYRFFSTFLNVLLCACITFSK